MVKLTDLKPGDIVLVKDEGVEREGIVTDVSREDNMVGIDNGVQEFWFEPDQIIPIPLNEDALITLGFERQEVPEGIKYLRGPFRILTPKPGDFSHLEMWYREDRRHFDMPLMVHELQNHYLQMTKVPLERPIIS